MRLNILFGGEAGQGPNILTHVLAESLVEQGYYVFYSRDYQSLIRGGHNFNVLTVSDKPVNSNDSKIDILVALDENTQKIHKPNLNKDGIIIDGKHPNMYYAGRLFKVLGMDFKLLEDQFKKLEKRFEENMKEAKIGYNEAKANIKLPKSPKIKADFKIGNQGIALGAIKSGLDIYYAYPMTPATPVIGELAKSQIENNHLVIELENEISVINAAIGSAITGAKSMLGTSGGGFDLMTEALSMTGIAEIPLVLYLAQRPGPASGVATYNAQGDLNMARHSGHGEFSRILLAPGDPVEAAELVNQAFYFSQKFKTPAIVIGDKHLAESAYTLTSQSKIVKVPKSMALKRINSYEADSIGCSTEDASVIKKNVENRLKKIPAIETEAKKFAQYKTFGKKNSKNVIVFWGSTKGAILDAIEGLDVKAIQILYLDPFPKQIAKELKDKNIILIENNSTGQLGGVIAENTGIFIKNKILRYDGRPFLCDELNVEIKKRLK
ncbi:MAG: 2-oxoacid:acceptor oxidoreductase family protein [archaeon]